MDMKNIKILPLIILLILTTLSEAQNFALLDSVINSSISKKAFPGAAIAVGSKNAIIYKKAYGNYTYDKASTAVTTQSMFDMASVTKAFSTNFCVMKLVDENKIDINKKVCEYIPAFGQNGKEDVRVIDLLIHESGLQAYYTPKEGQSRQSIIDSIMALPLSYKTNSDMIYSCLNFVTTMLVVEAASGERMYKFYKDNFTDPLEMKSTMYVPTPDCVDQCVTTFTHLKGIVHDPLARGLEGLSGNAGLFSSVEDLSKLCILLLNKGMYNGKRYLKAETIEYFSKKYSDRTTRAIGFDTRSNDGTASSGKLFSPGSYGHLGYTGTSIWIDPVKEIFVVFLTNRVYPDDTASIKRIRPKVHDAVIKSLREKK